MSNKLWAGRFTQETNKLLDSFNSSFPFDFRLWEVDIQASKVHAEMLGKTNIIDKTDSEKIIEGLTQLEKEISLDEKAWFEARQNEEDIHMAIERRLTELIGEPAKKLHTARSRNDQVVTDLRLWLMQENFFVRELLLDLRWVLVKLAERDYEQLMPGYTHLQKAQPISLGHHWLAHQERFTRDFERFEEIQLRLKCNPLGSGALAGTTYNIDRHFTTESLGFIKPSSNSLDAVSDRDFVAEHQFASSLLMIHLSQLAEELILWSTDEFKFIELDDCFATGSSMMPQKKNPDIPELVRGKTGRVVGNLQAILMTLKALPLAYNKDLQEDKEGLFDTCKTVSQCLEIMSRFLESLKINSQRLSESAGAGFMNATDAADYLVKKGIPFREAYYAVGQIIQYCVQNQKSLIELNDKEWQNFHPLFDRNIQKHIKPINCLIQRQSYGGTSPINTKEIIKNIWAYIEKQNQILLIERKKDKYEGNYSRRWSWY